MYVHTTTVSLRRVLPCMQPCLKLPTGQQAANLRQNKASLGFPFQPRRRSAPAHQSKLPSFPPTSRLSLYLSINKRLHASHACGGKAGAGTTGRNHSRPRTKQLDGSYKYRRASSLDQATPCPTLDTHTQTHATLAPCSPRLELPARDTFRGDDLLEHALVRRLPGQEVSLVQQTPTVSSTVVVVHARRTAKGDRGGGRNRHKPRRCEDGRSG